MKFDKGINNYIGKFFESTFVAGHSNIFVVIGEDTINPDDPYLWTITKSFPANKISYTNFPYKFIGKFVNTPDMKQIDPGKNTRWAIQFLFENKIPGEIG